MKKLTAVELFCGAGGLSLGLERSGFDVLFAVDNDKAAIETYRHNFNGSGVICDVGEVSPDTIFQNTLLDVGELDLLAGGPPCQGFSKQRRGAHILDDPRNGLAKHFVRLVDSLKPKYFLLENVEIFGQVRGVRELDHLNEILHNQYALFPKIYNSVEFGVAQTRKRFVLIGERVDLKYAFEYPKSSRGKIKTVFDAIGDMPTPPTDYSVHPEYFNHQRARVTPTNIERFSYVPQGGGWQDIPFNLRIPCHQKVDTTKGGWPDVYGRLKWDGQCPTITGGFDSFTRGRYGHPEEDRPLTPREAARIQGFPDKFKFFGTRGDIRRQIGNAVPPPLARKLGNSIRKSINLSIETSVLEY